MGFTFRKSINLGSGVKINLSKSGVGVSMGVKGARYSIGPRGSRISVGANGIYYRKHFSNKKSKSQKQQRTDYDEPEYIPKDENIQRGEPIETADVSSFIDSSSSDVIYTLNNHPNTPRYGSITRWAAVFFACIVSGAFGGYRWLGGLIILLPALIYAAHLDKEDEARSMIPLIYDLENDAAARFQQICQAFDSLARSKLFTRVEGIETDLDRKTNAGASTNLAIGYASISLTDIPPMVATNIDVPSVQLVDMSLYFMPDQILVLQNGIFGEIAYDSFRVQGSASKWVATDYVPTDAKVVDHTWLKVNKDGSPDKRFNGNRQVPVLIYAYLRFYSTTGLDLQFQVSNVEAAKQFAKFFSGYPEQEHSSKQEQEAVPESNTNDDTDYRPEEPKRRRRTRAKSSQSSELEVKRTAHEILEVQPGASAQEISAAYHRLAQMYHPDKVAGLGPEFGVIAEKRMKEINLAFEELRPAR